MQATNSWSFTALLKKFHNDLCASCNVILKLMHVGKFALFSSTEWQFIKLSIYTKLFYYLYFKTILNTFQNIDAKLFFIK